MTNNKYLIINLYSLKISLHTENGNINITLNGMFQS